MSGSSVLTGLIAQAGYWVGEKTEYKNNTTGQYQTWENSEFVALNDALISSLDIKVDSRFWYQNELRQQFQQLAKSTDTEKYQPFTDKLNAHQPWVIKDPKLWVSIGFWAGILGASNFKCIVLYRDIDKLWRSQVNKRIIYDYTYLRDAESASRRSLLSFLEEQAINYLEIKYDDLQNDPTSGIQAINRFSGTSLTVADWNKVYNPAKNTPESLLGKIKTQLIYFKNYHQRIR